MSGLQLLGLSKVMPGFILEADFTISQGERGAIVARSGSGKTTLLRLIAGLEALDGPQDQGSIRLFGRELNQVAVNRREIGILFQDSVLFPGMSVLENATFGLKMRKVSADRRRAEGLKWLQTVGLADRADGRIEGLSGGEKQRLAWVRALIWQPKLILLDEPFSFMDEGLRRQLRIELTELHQLCPVPLLMVSHDLVDAEQIATVRIDLVESADRSTRKFFRR